MFDVSGINSVGAFGHAARPSPVEHRPAVPKLDKTSSGRTTNDYVGTRPQQMPVQDVQPDRSNHQLDADVLTGPPPAFQASLLEVEAKLQNIIKRVEAAREMARNDQATSAKQESFAPNELDKHLAAQTAEGPSTHSAPSEFISANAAAPE